MSEWISVLDRTPERGARALVFGKKGANVATYDGHAIKPGMFWWDSHSDYIRDVTHWMPLPEPPQ